MTDWAALVAGAICLLAIGYQLLACVVILIGAWT
jgi:hypothetical protein